MKTINEIDIFLPEAMCRCDDTRVHMLGTYNIHPELEEIHDKLGTVYCVNVRLARNDGQLILLTIGREFVQTYRIGPVSF